jgi:hypothetical protein
MATRPIALLTDFGSGDPYVAAMKGVIYSRLPGALVVDVTHEVPRHDIRSAAYVLHCVEERFPAGTIFVCVVDPGVGSERPVLCLVRGERTFIAPGNGLLEFIATGGKGERWHVLRPPGPNEKVSPTFHGRDVFAPAAARLAAGTRLGAIARPVGPVAPMALFVDVPATGPARVQGSVLHIDRFGNIITNIRLRGRSPGPWSARIGTRGVRGSFRTYDDAPRGTPFLLRGSSGLLEISVRRGDAAKKLRAAPGDAITLRIA